MSVRVSDGGREGGREGRRRRSGYRTKNKNPTRQCGEQRLLEGGHDLTLVKKRDVRSRQALPPTDDGTNRFGMSPEIVQSMP